MRKNNRYEKILPVRLVSGLNESEHLYTLMVYVLGYSATRAYRLAINPNVSVNSAASLGCRLLSEPRIQNYITTLYRYQEQFTTNQEAYKFQ